MQGSEWYTGHVEGRPTQRRVRKGFQLINQSINQSGKARPWRGAGHPTCRSEAIGILPHLCLQLLAPAPRLLQASLSLKVRHTLLLGEVAPDGPLQVL